MTVQIPTKEQLRSIIVNTLMLTWDELIPFVENYYDFEPVWDDRGKLFIINKMPNKICFGEC